MKKRTMHFPEFWRGDFQSSSGVGVVHILGYVVVGQAHVAFVDFPAGEEATDGGPE